MSVHIFYVLSFLELQILRLWYSGLWLCVALHVYIGVSEKCTAFIISVKQFFMFVVLYLLSVIPV